MNKYTVIFSSGRFGCSITQFVRIECEEKEIQNELLKQNIEMSQVWFMFNGHCELGGPWGENSQSAP